MNVHTKKKIRRGCKKTTTPNPKKGLYPTCTAKAVQTSLPFSRPTHIVGLNTRIAQFQKCGNQRIVIQEAFESFHIIFTQLTAKPNLLPPYTCATTDDGTANFFAGLKVRCAPFLFRFLGIFFIYIYVYKNRLQNSLILCFYRRDVTTTAFHRGS